MVRIALATFAVSVAATSAQASPFDEFGSQGHIIISADRLSPFIAYDRVRETDQGGDSNTASGTSVSLFWSGAEPGVNANGAPSTFFDIPRLGFDYVAAPHVTVGGNLFFTIPMSSTRSTTNNNTTTSRDGAKVSAFGLGARVGYIVPLAPKVSFWPRGGLSYAREGVTNPPNNNGNQTSDSLSQTAIDLEALVVISPVQHFAFTLGPVFDVPLAGNFHNEFVNNNMTVSTDTDASQLHIGITIGLLGWF